MFHESHFNKDKIPFCDLHNNFSFILNGFCKGVYNFCVLFPVATKFLYVDMLARSSFEPLEYGFAFGFTQVTLWLAAEKDHFGGLVTKRDIESRPRKGRWLYQLKQDVTGNKAVWRLAPNEPPNRSFGGVEFLRLASCQPPPEAAKVKKSRITGPILEDRNMFRNYCTKQPNSWINVAYIRTSANTMFSS
ncbi:hypothetical protein BDC45DRAFT_541906 [Circinella umbellata]|nr:hypothetical protein BDC45DRAFT_541906 [Circinella umbellata]